MSSIAAVHDEKVESATELMEPSGDDVLDREHDLDAAMLAPRAKPRNARKEESLVGIVSQWIVDHQIGI